MNSYAVACCGVVDCSIINSVFSKQASRIKHLEIKVFDHEMDVADSVDKDVG